MVTGIVIPVDGKPYCIQALNSGDGLHREIKKALNGGYLEGVRFDEFSHAYIDEDGKSKGLPVNLTATNFFRKFTNFITYYGSNVNILGPAVLFGIDGCSEVDCPQHIFDMLDISPPETTIVSLNIKMNKKELEAFKISCQQNLSSTYTVNGVDMHPIYHQIVDQLE